MSFKFNPFTGNLDLINGPIVYFGSNWRGRAIDGQNLVFENKQAGEWVEQERIEQTNVLQVLTTQAGVALQTQGGANITTQKG